MRKEYKEPTVHTTKIHEQPNSLADSRRLIRLHEALRIEHLKEEERTPLLTIY